MLLLGSHSCWCRKQVRRRPPVSSPVALRSPIGKTTQEVMASLVNGTSGTSTPDNTLSTASMPGSVKQPAKPAVSSGTKNSDLNRKPANSPSNGAQRYDMKFIPVPSALPPVPSLHIRMSASQPPHGCVACTASCCCTQTTVLSSAQQDSPITRLTQSLRLIVVSVW